MATTRLASAHFNRLTPDEHERLALLMEEMGEVIQIIGKIMRHGFDSYHPDDEQGTTNRELLEKELGDVDFATRLLTEHQDVIADRIAEHSQDKESRVGKYLHHNG